MRVSNEDRSPAGINPCDTAPTPAGFAEFVSDDFAQGADVQPKMSTLAKVDGQSCCGAGRGAGGPPRSDMRHASVAGQSAALRASFQTAAPYVLVAIA